MKIFLQTLLFIILFQIIACKSVQQIGTSVNKSVSVKDSIAEKEYVTKIDTFYQQLSDSAKSIIYINCDSLNNPNISKAYTTQGEKLKMNFKFGDSGLTTKEKNQNIPLYIDCKIDSNKVAFSYFNTHKEKFISKLVDTSETKIISISVEKKLKKKEVFFMQLGRYTFWFFIIIICVLSGIGIAKLLKYLKWL